MKSQEELGSADVPRERKHYEPPRLRVLGRIEELTLTNAAGPNFDGGGGANIYAS